MHHRASVVLLLGLCACDAHAADSTAPLADAARCEFKDIRYLNHRLSEFAGRGPVVLAFASRRCPQAEIYLPAFRELEARFRAKDVPFLLVYSDVRDSIKELAQQALEKQIPFPVVQDVGGACAKLLGVERTGSAVILDKRLAMRHRGDWQDLEQAIDAVLAGSERPTANPTSRGTSLQFSPQAPPAEGVTYSESTAAILRRHCQECHRAGTEAPFSLTTYEEASAHAEAIAEVVADQRMPPWYAGAGHGVFANQRGMSQCERQAILDWVRGGRARGDASKAPAPLPPVESGGWTIGRPDLVVSASQAHELPAQGIIPYRYLLLPHVFKEEAWIQACEILPSNPKVVHHCNLGYIRPGEAMAMRRFDIDKIGALLGKVPGVSAMRLSDGLAMRIPRGAMLGMQIHYTTTGKQETNRMAVGFRFARGVVQKEGRHLLMTQRRLSIPPGAPFHRVTASGVLPCDAVGIGLFAHMHVRGRDMTFLAHYPDGRSETLLTIPNYNFDWQQEYLWKLGDRTFPTGTRIDCVAHYDNSAFNPYNPDPKATVHEGPQTYEEMHFGFLFYADAAECLELHFDESTGKLLSPRIPKSPNR